MREYLALEAIAKKLIPGQELSLLEAIDLMAECYQLAKTAIGPYPGCHHVDECNANHRCLRDPVCFN